MNNIIPDAAPVGWHVLLHGELGSTCSHLLTAPDVSAALAAAFAEHHNDCGAWPVAAANVERWTAGDLARGIR